MFKLLGKLPHDCYAACSGGSDSMAVLNFLTQCRKREVEVLFFNHGTETSNKSQIVVQKYCNDNSLKLHVGSIQTDKLKSQSQEEYWREERYGFFNQFVDKPIITAHHLDDQIENYLFTTLHGNARLIPYRRNNVIRPFLAVSKRELKDWVVKFSVPYYEDLSNLDTVHARNFIRHNIVPQCLLLHPGLHTVVRKRVISEFDK